jgi:hypothetical protein
MSGTIYLITEDGGLEEMVQQPYESEEMLQKHLASYPNLLAGDQINQDAPRRWVLVSREMGVPGEEDGSNRWSLDHLFLDQDAIPTLVETKRSSDTRSRREVVAQMLDYAANAVLYWSVEKIQASFEANCQDQGEAPSDVLLEFLGVEDVKSVQDFWDKVKTNLQAGKIRLLFMADQIAPELRRIVEFLNGQMDPAEVLAVQIPQFVGKTQKALVPMVIGLTAKAEQVKGGQPRPSKDWDEPLFFETVQQLVPSAVEPTKKILQWYMAHNLSITWGGGPVSGSFYGALVHNENKFRFPPVAIDTRIPRVRLWIQFGRWREKAPFTDKSKCKELLERFNKIPGCQISMDIIDDVTPRRPSLDIDLLQEDGPMQQFLETLEWAIKEIEAT